MKPLSLAFLSCIVLTFIVFVFFWMALPVKNDIHFTDLPDITQPTVTFVDQIQGNPQAPITIVLFGEYGCPSCASTEENIRRLLNDKKLDVRYVWKDLALETDKPGAFQAAMAARCAGKQKKFWEFHDALIAEGSQSTLGNFTNILENIGLDASSFSACMTNRTAAALVERDVLEAEALSITATPTVFVNDERVTGLVSESDLRAMITQISHNKK